MPKRPRIKNLAQQRGDMSEFTESTAGTGGDPRLRRIRIVSTLFRFLIVAALALVAGVSLIIALDPFLFATPVEARSSGEECCQFFAGISLEALEPFKNVSPEYRWVVRPTLLAGAGMVFVGIWFLYRLFSLYSDGMIFTAANIRYIRWFGVWLMMYWLADIVLQLVPATVAEANVTVDFGSSMLWGGLLVLLVGWIMDEGRKACEEQALTV